MSNFISDLTQLYTTEANESNAVAMFKYMKGHFKFFGIKTEQRRFLHKHAYENNIAEVKEKAREIARELYAKPEREYHYSAIEILIKVLKKKYRRDDISLIEHLLVTNSWWDTVDVIAKYILGEYVKQYPEAIPIVIERFSLSDNMWLNRSAILFQLGYKKDTDIQLLFRECLKHKQSKDFFIQKAIGWALREYGKVDAEAIREFVAEAGLKPLSTREALKNI